MNDITKDIKYIGVNDHEIDLFEGQYTVENGMAYNSYVIIDDKIAVMDSVDARFTDEWLGNIKSALGERRPDYLVVQHMEPDHSANIMNFAKAYPDAVIVSSAKAFVMMKQFFGTDFADRRIVAAEGDFQAVITPLTRDRKRQLQRRNLQHADIGHTVHHNDRHGHAGVQEVVRDIRLFRFSCRRVRRLGRLLLRRRRNQRLQLLHSSSCGSLRPVCSPEVPDCKAQRRQQTQRAQQQENSAFFHGGFS